MGTFRVLNQAHVALAGRVRAAVSEVAESEGLGPVEVFLDLAHDPAPGDTASVHVALVRVAACRDLHFGPARRPAGLGGDAAEAARAAGRGLFQAPPLTLNAWFLVSVRSEEPRAVALLLGAVASSLHFQPTLSRHAAAWIGPAPGGAAGSLASPPVDSRGVPVRAQRPTEAAPGAAEETFAASLVDDVPQAEVAQWLAAAEHPPAPALQFKVQVVVDAPVEAIPVAREVKVRLP